MDFNGVNKNHHSYSYLTRHILNSPDFLLNNNNPFLVSPYTPTTNLVTKSQITPISEAVSTIVSELSTVFDFNTMTLRITTITNTTGGTTITISTTNLNMYGTDINITAANIITLTSPNLNIGAGNTTINGNVFFPNNAYFSSIYASTINGSTITFGTLTGSTISASTITFGTLTGSTINASTINVPTISTNAIIFSSLIMEPGFISSFIPAISTFNSSILIYLNGGYYKIPIYPV